MKYPVQEIFSSVKTYKRALALMETSHNNRRDITIEADIRNAVNKMIPEYYDCKTQLLTN